MHVDFVSFVCVFEHASVSGVEVVNSVSHFGIKEHIGSAWAVVMWSLCSI